MKHLKIILSISFVFLFLFSSQTMVRAQEALRMYTALDTNEAKIYIEAFTKDTGIKVDWVRMSAGEVLTRIKAEARNPQVSITYGGPSVEYIAAKKEGLLVPYKSPVGAPFLKGNLKDSDDFWTGFYFGAIGFGNNTAWFEKNKREEDGRAVAELQFLNTPLDQLDTSVMRKLARELGVDLAPVPGSGPKGRILKEDVQAFVKTAMQGGGATVAGGGAAVVSCWPCGTPTSGIRES